jgi:hypothetical protein
LCPRLLLCPRFCLAPSDVREHHTMGSRSGGGSPDASELASIHASELGPDATSSLNLSSSDILGFAWPGGVGVGGVGAMGSAAPIWGGVAPLGGVGEGALHSKAAAGCWSSYSSPSPSPSPYPSPSLVPSSGTGSGGGMGPAGTHSEKYLI